MTILVCIGSSCHVKGSYNIKNFFEEKISEHNLNNDVILQVSFCLGHCKKNGVTIKIDDELISGVTIDNINDIFETKVLNVIK